MTGPPAAFGLFQAIKPRHHDVHDHRVRTSWGQPGEGLNTVLGRDHFVAVVFQGSLQRVARAGWGQCGRAQLCARLPGGSGATLGVALRFLRLFVLPIGGQAEGFVHVQHRDHEQYDDADRGM
jgi:hypothetical protein